MSDEDFDPFVGGPPPDPSERTWRHPSEVAAEARANAAVAPTRPRRPSGATLLIAGSLGAAACLTVIALAQAAGSGSATPTGVAGAPIDAELGAASALNEPFTSVPPTTVPPIATVSTSTEAPAVPTPAPALASADTHLVSIVSGSDTIGSAVLIGDRLITSADVAGDQLSLTYQRAGSGSEHTAYLVGFDPFSDLAVYRPSARTVASQTLTALSTGTDLTVDPATDPTGTVVVLASVDPADPSGALQTSVGLITSVGTERTSSDGRALVGLIDTNLRQPENGGLLLDPNGRLLGIVVGTTSTLASAVPIDDALVIADHLADQGWASEAWIGFIGLDGTNGVEVIAVEPDSPAERAGLLPGDVVFFLGSTRVDHMADITAALRRTEPGEVLVFAVDRNGEPVAVNIETIPYGSDMSEIADLEPAEVIEPASG